jgi:4-hydroxy-tetrahydrodipicolinate reductase
MALRICIAGVTGWTGSAVARAVLDSPEFELVGAVARGAKGQDAGLAVGRHPCGIQVSETTEQALDHSTDVFIDYTHPEVVKGNVELAISRGVRVVIGTSGLTGEDYENIGRLAEERRIGVVAAGNFSLTAALAKHFSGIAARHIPHWEIVDYSSFTKPDSPSGTTQELAEYLGSVASNEYGRPVEETLGSREARGATIGGAQVHSVRLPGFVLSFEAVFGLPNERLSVRHDAGAGAEPYVTGTLLAAKRAMDLRGLVRGLDTLLFGGE